MALSRRAKITAGVFGLTASALFAASGSAFAADQDGSGTELVIVEQAQAPASSVVHSPGDCPQGASTVADSR
jgi:hypothetical protein